MEQEVLEYFEAYFGGQLNESTTDEDIIDAVYDLVDLTEAVLEAVGLDEGEKMPGILPYTDAQWNAHKKKNNVQTTDINWTREYIKNKGKVPYGQLPKQRRPFGPRPKPGKDNVQPL